MALAFMVAFGWIFWEAKKRGEDLDHYYNLCLIGLIGGIVGARLVYVVVTWKLFKDHPFTILNLRTGGMVWYGGLIAVALLIWAYTKWKDLNLYNILDLVAAPTILGLGIGRIGCLMSGCCYGKPSSLPWAIRYPETHVLSPDLIGVRVHPSPVYEMIACFAIAGFLAYLQRRKTRDGQVAWSMLLLYGAARFVLEIWRGDELRGFVVPGILSVSQAISIVVVILAAIMLLKLGHRPEPER